MAFLPLPLSHLHHRGAKTLGQAQEQHGTSSDTPPPLSPLYLVGAALFLLALMLKFWSSLCDSCDGFPGCRGCDRPLRLPDLLGGPGVLDYLSTSADSIEFCWILLSRPSPCLLSVSCSCCLWASFIACSWCWSSTSDLRPSSRKAWWSTMFLAAVCPPEPNTHQTAMERRKRKTFWLYSKYTSSRNTSHSEKNPAIFIFHRTDKYQEKNRRKTPAAHGVSLRKGCPSNQTASPNISREVFLCLWC